jgi:hypothetical protein
VFHPGFLCHSGFGLPADRDPPIYFHFPFLFEQLKASFHSGKLSVDWNGSLSCELWVGTNDFNTKKDVLVGN